MNEENVEEEIEKEVKPQTLTKKVATSAVFIAVGLILSFLNPFAYFELFGTKINPFAQMLAAEILGMRRKSTSPAIRLWMFL